MGTIHFFKNASFCFSFFLLPISVCICRCLIASDMHGEVLHCFSFFAANFCACICRCLIASDMHGEVLHWQSISLLCSVIIIIILSYSDIIVLVIVLVAQISCDILGTEFM